jgi:hypothetical protein
MLGVFFMLSVIYVERHNSALYAECHYAECPILGKFLALPKILD